MANFWEAAKNLNSPLSLKSRNCFKTATSFASKWKAPRLADCPAKGPWKSGLQPDESITRQQFADLSSGQNDPPPPNSGGYLHRVAGFPKNFGLLPHRPISP